MRRIRLRARDRGTAFLCRYVQRTLAQQGEEALTLPLVARHLTACPVCRTQRRRILRVDRAFHDSLKEETPPWFDGRWEGIRRRLPVPSRTAGVVPAHPPRAARTALVVLLAALITLAWFFDHAPTRTVPGAIEVAPGVQVTAASLSGRKAEVVVEPESDEEGTIFIWLRPEQIGPDQEEQR
jgi:anti-sigma factor RsiW